MIGSSLFSKPSEVRLARSYAQQGKFAKAEAVLFDAYSMQVASFGATHPLVGKTLYEMGVVYIVLPFVKFAQVDRYLCVGQR